MKKLFTSVLMLSMVLAGMNVFNSCKDYDEDEYNDMLVSMDKNDADLRNLISTNYHNLKVTADSLAKVQALCQQNCSTKFEELNNAIKNRTKITQDSLKILANDIADLKTADQTLQKNIDGVKNTLSKVDSILGDSIDVVAGQVKVNSNNIAKLFDVTHVLDSTIIVMQSDIKTLYSNDKAINTRIDSLESAVNAKFYTVETNLDKVAKTAGEALERAINDSLWIENLKSTVKDVNGRIDSLAKETKLDKENLANYITSNNARVDSIANVTDNLATLISSARSDFEAADNLLKKQDSILAVAITNLNTVVDGIKTSVDDLDKSVDELNKKYSDFSIKVGNIETTVNELGTKVTDLTDVKIPAIETALSNLAAKDDALAHSIDSLAQVVKANEDSIAEINSKLNTISGRLDKIDNALKSLITGIIVQGTYNPVFGTVSLPVGISSNVLIAYYGSNDNPIVFPTTATANYVKNSDQLTAADWGMISSGLTTYNKNGNSVLFSETDDNAGTIYVTINPNTVDLAGQQLTLVNSKDEESGVKLTTLKKENDTELKFGYTRAASNNGFYSAKASVSKDAIDNVKINVESGLKSAFKNVLTERSAASVATLAGKLYNQFDGIATANAVKASWTDYNGEHSVYSQYGVAATAIKPLSFKFLEDVNYTKIPGYQRVWNFIDDVVGEFKSVITSNWPSLSTLTAPTISSIDIDNTASDVFNIKIEFDLPAGYSGTVGEDGYLAVYHTSTGDLAGYVKAGSINYDAATGKWVMSIMNTDLRPEVQEMYNRFKTSVNTALENSNTSLADFVDQVNDMLDQINGIESDLTNATTNIENKLFSYLDKVNNKLCNVINNANARIQPVLVVSDNAGTHFGSKAKNAPSVAKSAQITLHPTTYTAEIVAPAFKKHVACTNVYNASSNAQAGNASCKAALEAVNAQSQVNEVVEGTVRSIPVTLKSGYVYEFSYSALDYQGKISMHKYYVQY